MRSGKKKKKEKICASSDPRKISLSCLLNKKSPEGDSRYREEKKTTHATLLTLRNEEVCYVLTDSDGVGTMDEIKVSCPREQHHLWVPLNAIERVLESCHRDNHHEQNRRKKKKSSGGCK